MGKKIKVTQNELKGLIKECIKKVLSEKVIPQGKSVIKKDEKGKYTYVNGYKAIIPKNQKEYNLAKKYIDRYCGGNGWSIYQEETPTELIYYYEYLKLGGQLFSDLVSDLKDNDIRLKYDIEDNINLVDVIPNAQKKLSMVLKSDEKDYDSGNYGPTPEGFSGASQTLSKMYPKW